MGKAGGGARPALGDRQQPNPPAAVKEPCSCWTNRQRGWGVQGREKAGKANGQSDLGALERRVPWPVGFRVRRAGGVPAWANRREPTVRSERLKCSGFSADCLQPRVVFCSYRAEPQQEEPRPPGEGERRRGPGAAAALRGAPGPVTALPGVEGWGGWGVRDKSFSPSTAAPSPALSFPRSLARRPAPSWGFPCRVRWPPPLPRPAVSPRRRARAVEARAPSLPPQARRCRVRCSWR